MRLKDNWKALLLKAWSVRLILIAGILTGLEIALPLMQGLIPWMPPGVFAALSGLASGGALVARVLTQNNIAG